MPTPNPIGTHVEAAALKCHIATTLVPAALLPRASLTKQHMVLLHRDMRFGVLAVLDCVTPALGLATGIAAARSVLDSWSLIGATVTETPGTLIVTWSFARWWPRLPSYTTRIWSMVRFGPHITVYNLANYMTVSVAHIPWGDAGRNSAWSSRRRYKMVVQRLQQPSALISRVGILLLSQRDPADIRYRRAYFDVVSAMPMVWFPASLSAW